MYCFTNYPFNLDQLLKYPSFDIRLENRGGKTLVFDPIRKAWFQLSPEEWVRQHLIHYLLQHKQVPASLMSVEKQVELNGQNKRYDLVVYKNTMPCLVVECKAPFVMLDVSVAEQAMRYNLILKAPYLMITNGVHEFVFCGQKKLDELPSYPDW